MSDYFAKEILGEDAIYGIAKVVFRDAEEIKGKKRLVFGGVLILQSELTVEGGEYNLADCEIYIKPIRREQFRGQRGLRIDQAVMDYHFQHSFGDCVDEEHSFCSSCEERGFETRNT